MISYYPETVKAFQEIIRRNSPGAKAIENRKETSSPEHMLWMLKYMQSFKGMGRRGRWIGHVNGVLVDKGWLNNADSQKWFQEDVENGKE